MRCSACGEINDERAKFCSECGSSLASAGAAAAAPAAPAPQVAVPVPEAPVPAAPPPAGPEVARYAARLLESAAAARQAGQAAPAETICKEVLRFDPLNLIAHSLLADLLEQRGNLQGAAAERQEVVRLNALQTSDAASRPRTAGLLLRGISSGISTGMLMLVSAGLLLLCVGVFAASSLRPHSGAPAAPVVGRTGDFRSAELPGLSRPAALSPPAPSSPLNAEQPGANSSNDPDSLVVGSAAASGAVQRAPSHSDSDAAARTGAVLSTPGADASARTTFQTETQGPARTRRIARVLAPSAVREPAPGFVIIPPARPERPILSAALPPARSALARSGEEPVRVTMGEAPSARSSAPVSFGSSLSKARGDFQAQRYAEAIPEYRSAVRSAPTVLDAATARQELAMAYSAMHSPREANDEYRAAEGDYSSLLSGPDAARAQEAIRNIRAQLQLPENRQ